MKTAIITSDTSINHNAGMSEHPEKPERITASSVHIPAHVTIFFSDQPHNSKWWWIGAILKILLPVSLKETTWIITEIVSNTNKPPIIARTISCLTIIAIAANEPPNDNEPVSPMKILAGGALYQRKPKHEPTIEPQKIDSSPTLGMYWICK